MTDAPRPVRKEAEAVIVTLRKEGGASADHLASLLTALLTRLSEGERETIEECAKVAEATKTQHRIYGAATQYPTEYDETVPVWRDGKEIAAAIRALQHKDPPA